MFVANAGRQMTIFDTLMGLTKRERARLEASWSGPFHDDVFARIDEAPFAVLYSERCSRPNAPVNVLVGALILKEMLRLTDEELVEDMMFDVRFQHALGTTSFPEQPVSESTLFRFRARLCRHLLETGEDLLKDCVLKLARHACSETGIDGSVRRMDSMMVGMSARALSREELVYECVAYVCRYLKGSRPDLLPKGPGRYADRDEENRTFYHDRKTSREERARRILADADALVEALGDSLEGDEGGRRLELLVRALEEQTVVDAPADKGGTGATAAGDGEGDDAGDGDASCGDVATDSDTGAAQPATDACDGRAGDDHAGGGGAADRKDGTRKDDEGASEAAPAGRRLRTREDGMPAGSGMMQSPHDPQATFRRKAGKDHRGYAANFEESCGANGTIVTNYQYGPNNTSDAEFLRQSLEDAEPVEGGAILVTDGGYDGEANIALAADKGVELVTTSLVGKDPADRLADFEWAPDGRSLVRCAAGHEPERCGFYESSGQVRAVFPAGTCAACPFRGQCGARCGKRVDSVTASPKSTRRARHLRRMRTDEFKDMSRLRNGAETVPSVMRRRYDIDGTPAGTAMGGMHVGLKVAAMNFRKLEAFRRGGGNYRRNPLLEGRAA